ncbi:hypothetical protein J6524_34485 [Bradyrhizobium sp. WSM 1738]|uniref:hypothetical protein n=1 Tax=Bradyrhizobium hereditatis TaxID=2821405 RepID=UPI001CE3A058|nr:hypothetical protein [Bradyrhizobium hereditatis]MCA6119945.1 hypothetical protein [Bradyrhizobium hereditatis]
MQPDAVIPTMLTFVVGILFVSLIHAAVIKFFERKLTFGQAYLIVVVTTIVSGTLLAVYTSARPLLGFSETLDLLANLAALVLMGFMITRLAANYGIKKQGRFSLGTKVMFTMLLMVLIFMIALAGVILLLGGGLS